jgi:prevent-host-death family protein
MAIFMAYIIDMKEANIAEIKNHLSRFLSLVEKGEEVVISRRNIPIARVIPVRKRSKNKTVLGCGKNSVIILGDITEPLIPENNWDMLSSNENNS